MIQSLLKMIKSLLLLTFLSVHVFSSVHGESCDVGPCSFDMYLHKYLERSEAVRQMRANQRAAAAKKGNGVNGENAEQKFAFDSTEGIDEFGEFRDRFAHNGGQKKFARTGQQNFAFAQKPSQDEVVANFDVDHDMM